MDRRQFIKAISALGFSSAVPTPALSLPQPAFATAASETMAYQWAEVIVRSHNKCSVPMLQRLLKLSSAEAGYIQSRLLQNGILGSQNSYGMYQAAKPMFQELFPSTRPSASRLVEDVLTETNQPDPSSSELDLTTSIEEDPKESEDQNGTTLEVETENPVTEMRVAEPPSDD